MTTEQTFLGIAALALVAIIIYETRKPSDAAETVQGTGAAPATQVPVTGPGISLTPDSANMAAGPAYLVYNMPWAFSPPVQNTIPASTSGMMGQVVQNPSGIQVGSGCNCGG